VEWLALSDFTFFLYTIEAFVRNNSIRKRCAAATEAKDPAASRSTTRLLPVLFKANNPIVTAPFVAQAASPAPLIIFFPQLTPGATDFTLDLVVRCDALGRQAYYCLCHVKVPHFVAGLVIWENIGAP
jgi:hypothetical protein